MHFKIRKIMESFVESIIISDVPIILSKEWLLDNSCIHLSNFYNIRSFARTIGTINE